jgi:hypothetical protein
MQFLAALVFEVIFTTLCVIAAIPKADSCGRRGGFTGVMRTMIRNHERCVEGIMEIFLETTTYFALSVIIASLITGADRHGGYASDRSSFFAMFSIAPLHVVLSLCQGKRDDDG